MQSDDRWLVCGSRSISEGDRQMVELALLGLRTPSVLIHGACPHPRRIRGTARRYSTDMVVAEWYAEHEPGRVAVVPYPADWDTHGRAAGPIRNSRMLAEGKPTHVIAFPGGAGTRDMVRKARRAGIPVIDGLTGEVVDDAITGKRTT